MIRRDFITGGFPICRTRPVICIVKTTISVSYNNFDLRKAIDSHKSLGNPMILIGVWPGKKTTDIFILNPEYYGKEVPPPEHADIDNSSTIYIYTTKGAFNHIEYIPGPHTENMEKIVSSDPALYDYVKKTNLICNIIEINE